MEEKGSGGGGWVINLVDSVFDGVPGYVAQIFVTYI